MMRDLLLFVALCLCSALMAQPVVGIKAGVDRTLTTLSPGDQVPAGTPTSEVEDGFGYHGGAFAEFNLGDVLFVRPEPHYAVRTFTIRSEFESPAMLGITARVEGEMKVKRSTVELPLLFGYRITPRTSVLIGPSARYLLANHTETNGSASIGGLFPGLSVPLSTTDDTVTGLNEWCWEVVAGLNHRLEQGLDLGLRYGHGIGYLESDTELLKTRQHVLHLAVGWAFLR
jgi:hypothetical protein